MNIPPKYRHEYVCCLPKELERAIMNEVERKISALLLSADEKKQALEDANTSKVCDLTETINIRFRNL